MSYYYGTTTILEAISKCIEVLIEIANEKAIDGKVYIRIENDGEIVINSPSSNKD